MSETLLRYPGDNTRRSGAELQEVRTPLSQASLVCRSQSTPLEELVAGLGEVLEEQVPIVHIVSRYEGMRADVAVGKKGRAPRELYYPNDITIATNYNQGGKLLDSFAHISLWSEVDVYLNSFRIRN